MEEFPEKGITAYWLELIKLETQKGQKTDLRNVASFLSQYTSSKVDALEKRSKKTKARVYGSHRKEKNRSLEKLRQLLEADQYMEVTKSMPRPKQERQLICEYKRLSKAHKRLGKRADREEDLMASQMCVAKVEAAKHESQAIQANLSTLAATSKAAAELEHLQMRNRVRKELQQSNFESKLEQARASATAQLENVAAIVDQIKSATQEKADDHASELERVSAGAAVELEQRQMRNRARKKLQQSNFASKTTTIREQMLFAQEFWAKSIC